MIYSYLQGEGNDDIVPEGVEAPQRAAAAYLAVSWLLIQVVETVFPAFGFGGTDVRIVIIVLVIGLIPVLIFSWAFELTPEGLKKEWEVDRSRSISARTSKTLDRIIMLVLALALGFFAFDKFVLDPARDATREEAVARQARSDALVESYGDKSIAVLPFVNMSSDPEQEYFSNGISEELLNLLTRIPQLRVISRSSAFSYKGKDIDIPTMAEQLNVAHILEGSVRKSGNRVRITAQLIEAALKAMEQETIEAYRLSGQALAYYQLGQKDESDNFLAELIEKHTEDASLEVATVFAGRRDNDNAFAWLERAREQDETGIGSVATYYAFRNLHDDPRWQPFLAKMGQSDAQLAAIEFNVPLPEQRPK